jgi:choline kinase
MQAILLAAGVGRRLASLGGELPKSLLTFDERSLLLRHLDHLRACGVDRVTVVVGHLSDKILLELATFEHPMEIETVYNDAYQEGSILSLATGLRHVRRDRDAIVMDADVLYHSDVLRRLVDAPSPRCFLLDPRSEAHGEEMMLGVRDGQVRTITRRIGQGWELIGEGVGFFKLPADDFALLLEKIDERLAEGHRNADYESAIDAFLEERPAGFVSVSDLPWTEIDFDEDVERARRVVLPALQGDRSAERFAS